MCACMCDMCVDVCESPDVTSSGAGLQVAMCHMTQVAGNQTEFL